MHLYVCQLERVPQSMHLGVCVDIIFTNADLIVLLYLGYGAMIMKRYPHSVILS